MDSSRESRTVEESNVNHTRSIWRPYDVPSSQDISAPSTGFVSSRSSSFLSRVADLYPQSPDMDFTNRHGFIDRDSQLTPDVNIPPQRPIYSRRENLTIGESTAYTTPAIFRSYDVPQSRDISAPSSGFSSSASLSRAAGYPQSTAMNLHARPDLIASPLTPCVNISSQLPMDNRRESQTVGKSTVNNSTAMFRPYNVPAMIGGQSSQVTFTLPQSTYLVPPSSSASLSRVGDYSQSLANEVRIRIYNLAVCRYTFFFIIIFLLIIY